MRYLDRRNRNIAFRSNGTPTRGANTTVSIGNRKQRRIQASKTRKQKGKHHDNV